MCTGSIQKLKLKINQFSCSLLTFLLPVPPVYEPSPIHAPLLQVKPGLFFPCVENILHTSPTISTIPHIRIIQSPTRTRLKRRLCLNPTTNPGFLGATTHSVIRPEVHVWSALLINDSSQLGSTELSNPSVMFHIFKETNRSVCPGWPSKL